MQRGEQLAKDINNSSGILLTFLRHENKFTYLEKQTHCRQEGRSLLLLYLGRLVLL